MICFLSHFLHQQLDSALIRGETHEAARITAELEKHGDTCMTCAGIDQNFLVNNFFAGLQIVVLK